MRILWKSNAPWAATGYGTQGNSLLPRLREMPEIEDIGLFCYYGIQGGKSRQKIGIGKGINKPFWADCYPLRGDMWGNDVIQDHAMDFDADVVITLMDIWVLADDYGHRGFRWIPYMPIDMDPPPLPVIKKMKMAYKPIVYAKFAKDWCDRLGIETVYIPHGVETKQYKPFTREADRREAKKFLNFDPDCFLVGCVGANKGFPPRKGFPELFQAFKIFSERHTDARLYMHSLLTQEFGGPNLVEMADMYGIRHLVNFVDPYRNFLGIETDIMNAIYNAMDVFCLPSRGEGFGIPIIEAQAAGTPVIVTDYTAMPELCGSGWKVPVASKDYMPGFSWQAIADIGGIVDALEEAYKMDRKKKSAEAREFALQYDWDLLAENYWKPFIKELNQEVTPRRYRQPV